MSAAVACLLTPVAGKHPAGVALAPALLLLAAVAFVGGHISAGACRKVVLCPCFGQEQKGKLTR